MSRSWSGPGKEGAGPPLPSPQQRRHVGMWGGMAENQPPHPRDVSSRQVPWAVRTRGWQPLCSRGVFGALL